MPLRIKLMHWSCLQKGDWKEAYVTTSVEEKTCIMIYTILICITCIIFNKRIENILTTCNAYLCSLFWTKLVGNHDAALEEFPTESLRWHSLLLCCSTSALCGLVSVVFVALRGFVSLLSPVRYPRHNWRMENVFLSQLLSAAARPQRSPRKSTKVEKLQSIPR